MAKATKASVAVVRFIGSPSCDDRLRHGESQSILEIACIIVSAHRNQCMGLGEPRDINAAARPMYCRMASSAEVPRISSQASYLAWRTKSRVLGRWGAGLRRRGPSLVYRASKEGAT